MNEEETAKAQEIDDSIRNEKGFRALSDVFNENLSNWPTEALKMNLLKLKPEEGAEVYLHLNDGDYDLTKEALAVEKKFRPIVTIRTQELKTELDRWGIGGGTFFRVIGDQPSEKESMRLCMQYLIIWTRQLFPFQFIFLSLPFFVATLFLWQFSAAFIPGVGTTWGVYVTLLAIGLLFILIGAWTAIEGVYKRFIKGYKNWKIIPDSMIGFVVPGILFWTTTLEYAITELVGKSVLPALIPISAWLSLALGLVILTIGMDFYIRGEKSYVERFSHPMDYAPLMLYLGRDKNENWVIDGAQFDYFHYKTSFIPKDKLAFHENDTSKENPWFIIDRSWHAFREFVKANLWLRIFANLVVKILIWVVSIGFYTIYALTRFSVFTINFITPYLEEPWFLAIAYIIIPMILLLSIWSTNRTREYNLDLWEELSHKQGDELLKYHHLTFDKLRIFWNLRNRDHKGEQKITEFWSKGEWIEGDKSRLVARIKFQYPFDQYEGWHTIRDTQEELLSLIALQVKNRELRNIQKEIRRAKRKLFKYRSPFIKEKMRQRKEQNPELQEQSEEHSTPEDNNDVEAREE
ncbi:MAG: hypothetical protein ACTSPK_00710 [Candidatus Heimdallarchaeota archaeon]